MLNQKAIALKDMVPGNLGSTLTFPRGYRDILCVRSQEVSVLSRGRAVTTLSLRYPDLNEIAFMTWSPSFE
jgi:hypothetical protein